MPVSAPLRLADLILQFGRVNRATYHPDGERPESDTDHTVMLAVLACAVAANHSEMGLDVGLVAEYALVHDLPEALCGDTQSFGISTAAKLAKEEAEQVATEQIFLDLGYEFPWLNRLLEYEVQRVPEARFVRYLDKVLPKLTHALNGGAAFRRLGFDADHVREVHDLQIRVLAVEYPEFPVVDKLLRDACDECEAAYRLVLKNQS